jgi:acyl carrier protein
MKLMNLTRDSVKEELIRLLKSAREDWDSSLVVTDDTGLFHDLGFESIDAVGLSASLEDHFNRTLPFPEFMTKAKREEWPDITIGRLVDFIMSNLQAGNEAAR